MPRIISSHDKFAVIDDWLSGESRNDISIKQIMGSGTVYNIIQEWRIGIGVQKADSLRELALKLKKTGLTVWECANGLRSLMIFKKYGIKGDEDQEHLIYFLKEIYTKCQEVGFTPLQVFDYISDILKFCSDIAISQIPLYLKKKIEEKEDLERAVQRLSKKTKELEDIREDKQHELERLSKMEERMTQTYKMFTSAQFRLEQFGIKMDDMDKFVKCIVGMSKENYDYVKIVDKIANHEKLEKDLDYYKEEIILTENKLAQLNQKVEDQKNNLKFLKIKLDNIDELESYGFGISELRTLIHMINEIGLGHKINYEEIRKKYFDDMKNYEEVIGSRIEIERLKKGLKTLQDKTMKEREKYESYPNVIESIIRLAGSGVSEDDIVKIDKILSMNDYFLYKDKLRYKEDLIDDLQKYRNLKIAIKNLEDIEIDLKSTKKTQDQPTKKKPTTNYKTKRK